MKTFGTAMTTAAALAALLVAPLPGHAQADKPAVAKADTEAAPAAQASKRSRSNVDARVCLELATNVEIRKCAEKYR